MQSLSVGDMVMTGPSDLPVVSKVSKYETKYLNTKKGKSPSLETPLLLASPQQGSLMCYKLQILIQFNQTIFLSNSASSISEREI